jgi:altronate hydrolase
MNQVVLKVHPLDNVLVALTDLNRGDTVEHEKVCYRLLEDIPAKHKFFTTRLGIGQDIIMYGNLVGKTLKQVKTGNLMSTENVGHDTSVYQYNNYAYQWEEPNVSDFEKMHFKGYHRDNGSVGTANYWLFIPTVFCENRNMDIIKDALHHELGYAVSEKYRSYARQLVRDFNNGDFFLNPLNDLNQSPSQGSERIFKNVDGVKFLNHQGGCGGTRQDAATLSKLLAAYADHPNVGGITILSLGCENLQVDDFIRDLIARNSDFEKPLYIFEQQNSESEESLITKAIHKTFGGLIEINKITRRPAPLSKLCIGVKCGGSDGFSGISANPAVGHCADLLVALGGKVLLAEFPELCGAEQQILDRIRHPEKAKKFIALMQSYSDSAIQSGSGFHMNPSPGNIKDGLITDAMKSNGAVKKGGTSPVEDVLEYTEPATKPGLTLVCTPGNDVEATTGQAASGATLILFTTGLGTPTGNPISPVIKVATNNNLFARMGDIIDISTGQIIEGKKSIQEMGNDILMYCIKAASGEVIPKAIALGQDDFIPWKRGISL